MTSRYKIGNVATGMAITMIVIVFWAAAFRYAYNFPYYDDFENIIRFIYQYAGADSLARKGALLVEQNFEHRVLFAKILTLLAYKLTGEVNIRLLILLGDLSLVGTLVLMGSYFFKKQLSAAGVLAIACLLFQLQHYEDSISWATCSLQHAPCIFFSLWSFHLALNRQNVYLSGLLALIALLTSANGLSTVILWLIISWMTVLDKRRLLLPALLCVGITILHLATLELKSGSVTLHVLSNIGPKSLLLLSFAGQLADPEILGHIMPSVALGILFFSPLVVIIFKVITKSQMSLTRLQWLCAAGIGTLFFTAFLIVFARGSEPDFTGYLMDRYAIYPAFLGALTIGFYDRFWTGYRWMKAVVTAAAMMFCVTSYYIYFDKMVDYQNEIVANQFNFAWSKTIYYPPVFYDREAVGYLQKADQRFFFPSSSSISRELEQKNWHAEIKSLQADREESATILTLTERSFSKEIAGDYDKLHVLALNQSGQTPAYLFVTRLRSKRSVKAFYTHFEKPFEAGFVCQIYKKKIKSGNYALFLVVEKDNHVKAVFRLGGMQI